jgi:hypothetical protein
MRLRTSVYVFGLCALAGAVQAQPTAHYPTGIHGINAGTLPLPGFYVRDYNLFYGSDRLNDSTGSRTAPANFEAFTYANILRPIWITDLKLLGAYAGVDMVVPFIYRRLQSGKFDSSTFGLGDVLPEATLSWHFSHFDVCAGAGEWIPTGDSGVRPTTRPGLGYWGTMFTLGGTWYIDNDRKWSVGALNRYEINGQKQETDTTTGDAWTLEWGVGRKLTKSLTAGVAGYYQAKVTGDSGAHPQPLNRVAALGPELAVAFPSLQLSVALRYEYEFMSNNRAQGHTGALVLTKRF